MTAIYKSASEATLLGTHFPCFSMTQAQILTPSHIYISASEATLRGTHFTGFTSAKLQILTPRYTYQSRARISRAKGRVFQPQSLVGRCKLSGVTTQVTSFTGTKVQILMLRGQWADLRLPSRHHRASESPEHIRYSAIQCTSFTSTQVRMRTCDCQRANALSSEHISYSVYLLY